MEDSFLVYFIHNTIIIRTKYSSHIYTTTWQVSECLHDGSMYGVQTYMISLLQWNQLQKVHLKIKIKSILKDSSINTSMSVINFLRYPSKVAILCPAVKQYSSSLLWSLIPRICISQPFGFYRIQERTVGVLGNTPIGFNNQHSQPSKCQQKD